MLCRHLSNEWANNEQYSYGWFVPFFALYIFWQRWEGRPAAENPKPQVPNPKFAFETLTVIVALLFLLLPLRVFEIGNPDWRPLAWIHATIVVAVTLFFIWCAGGKPWVRHFAFPVAFILVAVPWVTPIEAPIVQGLMHAVAAIVSEMMNLLGIPAQLEGSVIRVNTGIVGVSEACSGVRSLQTSIMIGLLFGELYRLTTMRRFLLIFATIALALLANVMRTFFLVWLAATRGLSAMERNHDVAGYAVLLFVFAGAVGLAALWKQKSDVGNQTSEASNQRSAQSNMVGTDRWAVRSGAPADRALPNTFLPFTFYFLLSTFLWLLFVEIAAAGWYRLHERNLIARVRWTVQWPQTAPGFHDVKIDENVRRTLRFDEGRGVVWRSADSQDSLGSSNPNARENYLLYFFRWQRGSSSVLRARAHRPDICLPNTGWKQIADDGVRRYPVSENLSLPFRHFEFVRQRPGAPDQFAHAFFCVQADWIKAQSGHSDTDEPVAGKIGGWGRFRPAACRARRRARSRPASDGAGCRGFGTDSRGGSGGTICQAVARDCRGATIGGRRSEVRCQTNKVRN